MLGTGPIGKRFIVSVPTESGSVAIELVTVIASHRAAHVVTLNMVIKDAFGVECWVTSRLDVLAGRFLDHPAEDAYLAAVLVILERPMAERFLTERPHFDA